MVELRTPRSEGATRHLVRARAKQHLEPPRRCAYPGCGAFLASDNPGPYCSCHQAAETYNPRHDKDLDERVLWHLLGMRLGYEPQQPLSRIMATTDKQALSEAVARWRQRGAEILGLRGCKGSHHYAGWASLDDHPGRAR